MAHDGSEQRRDQRPGGSNAPDLDARIAQLRQLVDEIPARRTERSQAEARLADARRALQLGLTDFEDAARTASAARLPRPQAWAALFSGRYAERRDAARALVEDAARSVEESEAAVQRLVAACARRASVLDAATRAVPALAELEQARRLSELVAADDPRVDQVEALDAEIAAAAAQLREVEEAEAAVAGARAAARHLLSSLDSAHAWGTYDTFFGGGMLASAIKHDRIDSANREAAAVRASLHRVRAELADVRGDPGLAGVQIDGVTRGLDTFFDNIFSDWAVQSRIKDQREAARRVSLRLDQIAERLQHTRQELGARRSAALSRRHGLLSDR